MLFECFQYATHCVHDNHMDMYYRYYANFTGKRNKGVER